MARKLDPKSTALKKKMQKGKAAVKKPFPPKKGAVPVVPPVAGM